MGSGNVYSQDFQNIPTLKPISNPCNLIWIGGRLMATNEPRQVTDCGKTDMTVYQGYYAADEKSRFQKRKFVKLQPVSGLPKTVFYCGAQG